ncbi:MAG TPA: ABC transporter permease [Pseudolabrys sp.]|jgi:putative ABC transport system permease protein|nr:ABC transporter permease [Pseudolabrys sp.]
MLRIAVKMLVGDRAKYLGLLLGTTFTSFLVAFALSYFAGFMTRGFALISENPEADVWVMDPAVNSTAHTTNMPDSVLERVRSVDGVGMAVPLALGTADVHFANGEFQSFQVIGVDGPTLSGLPPLQDGVPRTALRTPDAAAVSNGGTSGKMQTPLLQADQWPARPHLHAPTRRLRAGDVVQIDDHRVRIVGLARALPRYPPQPLLYTTYANALRILPAEPHRLTFVLASAAPGVKPADLARRIAARTGLRARTADQFTDDTVWWFFANSEDVGDMGSMVLIAMLVGLGVTGVMLYMFTEDHLRQYAVLKAMGATPRLLMTMILVQAGVCALLGTGLGLGICAVVGRIAAAEADYPFRMMWFAPLLGGGGVVLVSLVAAAVSARPVFKLEPGIVFAGR